MGYMQFTLKNKPDLEKIVKCPVHIGQLSYFGRKNFIEKLPKLSNCCPKATLYTT